MKRIVAGKSLKRKERSLPDVPLSINGILHKDYLRIPTFGNNPKPTTGNLIQMKLTKSNLNQFPRPDLT
jgi:hypothetical protein